MIVIHIGLRKAGSTSIQAFLRDNTRALRALSVDYPRIGRRGRANHQNLAAEIRGLASFDPALGDVGALAAHWRSAPANTLIVSAENLEEAETAEALRLQALKRREDEEIRVVMIIRDLVGLTPSSYTQMVKLGVKTHTFDDFFAKRIKDRRVNFFRTARRWADAFGWESLRVRPLDPAHLLNGDLIDDFLSLADVDPADPTVKALVRPGMANVNPGWRVVEAIRALYDGRGGLPRDHPLARAASYTREERDRLAEFAIRLGAERGWNDDKGRYLTREQAQRCLETHQLSIHKLNRHLAVKLPKAPELDERGFVPRDQPPDASRIPQSELRAFYDALALAGGAPAT
jgi:hypothetical protein